MEKIRVVIDCNIWVSFGIGKNLNILPDLFSRDFIEVVASNELLAEIDDVCQRPKLQKYISENRYKEIIELVNRISNFYTIHTFNAQFSDIKDNYLLNLSESTQTNYLITGDKMLLKLGQYLDTKIISFADFQNIMPLLVPNLQ